MISPQYKIITFITIGIIYSALINADSIDNSSSQNVIYSEPVIKEATIEWPEPDPEQKMYLDYDANYIQSLQDDIPKELVIKTEKKGKGHYINTTLVSYTGQTVGARMLIDTGATSVVLRESMMADLGIYYSQTTSRKISTVNGIADALFAKIDSLQIGHEIIHNVKVAFVKDNLLGTNLLGMNVLENFIVTLDDNKSTLTLKKVK